MLWVLGWGCWGVLGVLEGGAVGELAVLGARRTLTFYQLHCAAVAGPPGLV